MHSAVLAVLFAFQWQTQGGRTTLLEDGKPVLVYNEREQLPADVPQDRARCCYVHPIYTPGGTVVTDDFPKDHYHHRGLFWAWPVVKTDTGMYDLWMMRGIRHKGYSVLTKGPQIVAVNQWIASDKPIVREQATITAYPANGASRDVDFELRLEALAGPVTLAGSKEQGKSYGGFSARFAPRTDTVIRTDQGVLAKDDDLTAYQWAEMEATYSGKRARLRIAPDPKNPAAPHQWCLRKYGFAGASFPGRSEAVQSYTIEPGKPLVLRFRVTVADVGAN
ncbi:MAG TPA: DUF6807 family protein [Bryobacteraceae bacterium]|nr:DUF6807 family protein [Bryobacteraceae bacterium]